MSKYGYILLILGMMLSIGIAPSSSAFEVTVQDTGPVTKSSIKKAEPAYPTAKPEDVECAKHHHMTRFKLNDTHAGMLFSLIAKKRTRVKLAWDHTSTLLFPYPEKRRIMTFSNSGISRLFFRSPKPVSGNFYVVNDKDVIIKTCRYSFLPAKRFRQSIRFSVNETEYDQIDELQDEDSNNISVSYSISTKTAIPDGGRWSFTTGLSRSDRSRDSQQIRSSLSYSW